MFIIFLAFLFFWNKKIYYKQDDCHPDASKSHSLLFEIQFIILI